MNRRLKAEIGELLDRWAALAREMLKRIVRSEGKLKGLRKGSSTLLALYIKEIQVLTPEKLRAIRRVRSQLPRAKK